MACCESSSPDPVDAVPNNDHDDGVGLDLCWQSLELSLERAGIAMAARPDVQQLLRPLEVLNVPRGRVDPSELPAASQQFSFNGMASNPVRSTRQT
eukprot:1294436-Pleurochrysis_carterae.AAC.1